MIILIGKTGSGKSTIKKELLKLGYDSLLEYTTRPPRDGEKNGVDYYFVEETKFKSMEEDNVFASVTSYKVANGDTWYYGIEKNCIGNKNGVLVTNPISLGKIYDKLNKMTDQIFYIKSDEELLVQRASERKDDIDEVRRRIQADRDDFKWVDEFADYSLTNDGVLSCYEIAKIIYEIYEARLNKQAIFIDADGVILDTIKQIVDTYNYDFMAYSSFEKISPHEIESWDFRECSLASPEYIDTYFNQQRFFDGVEFMPHAEESLRILNSYYNIYIVSSGSKPNLKLKEEFFEQKLPFARFIGVDCDLYKDKSHIDMSGGTFIDDRADNLTTSNAANKICFGDWYEWNGEWKKQRCYNWCDVMRHFGFKRFPIEVNKQ